MGRNIVVILLLAISTVSATSDFVLDRKSCSKTMYPNTCEEIFHNSTSTDAVGLLIEATNITFSLFNRSLAALDDIRREFSHDPPALEKLDECVNSSLQSAQNFIGEALSWLVDNGDKDKDPTEAVSAALSSMLYVYSDEKVCLRKFGSDHRLRARVDGVFQPAMRSYEVAIDLMFQFALTLLARPVR